MGGLTTHVLDTALGKPGQGISLALFRVDGDRSQLCAATTNGDGRTYTPLLSGATFALGTYELVFDVAPYFARHHRSGAEAPFLDQVTLRFTITRNEHYHVPLLVSPWSYSTYRGS